MRVQERYLIYVTGYDHKSLSQLYFKQFCFSNVHRTSGQNRHFGRASLTMPKSISKTYFFVLLSTRARNTQSQCYLTYTVLIIATTWTQAPIFYTPVHTHTQSFPENPVPLIENKTISRSCTHILFLLYARKLP